MISFHTRGCGRAGAGRVVVGGALSLLATAVGVSPAAGRVAVSTGASTPAGYHGVRDLLALVATSYRQLSQTSFPIRDVVVATVTGQGSLKVLGQHRVLRGRRAMNPRLAWIAPRTHRIAFEYTTDSAGITRGLAVMNGDGSHLRVLARSTNGFLWTLRWDASGTRLVTTVWRDPKHYIFTYNTNARHPNAHRVYSTRRGLYQAVFVGWSVSTFLVQIDGNSRNFVALERHGHLRRLGSSNVVIDGIAASPNGKFFAYSKHLRPGGPWALRTAPIAHPQQVHTAVTGEGTNTLQYSPGGQRLFYSVEKDVGGSVYAAYRIRWVWTAGSRPHKIGLSTKYVSYQLAGIVNA